MNVHEQLQLQPCPHIKTALGLETVALLCCEVLTCIASQLLSCQAKVAVLP